MFIETETNLLKIRVSVITSCYKGEKYLKSYFENVVRQTIFSKLEVVFLHNTPSEKEIAIVDQFKKKYPNQIQHIIVNPVESLGASWNKGWEMARGDCLAVWNVDDLRTENSLQSQMEQLDKNEECVLSYGDYIIVPEYGRKIGIRKSTPAFSKKHFSRSFPHGGAFSMWRKNLDKGIGKFDEQLKVVSDYDFSLRIAINNKWMCRTDEMLGYFTDSGEGLSTINNNQNTAIERNFLYKRYGNFDKIRFKYFDKDVDFLENKLLILGELKPLEEFFPNYNKIKRNRSYLWGICLMRNLLRYILNRLGLLALVYAVQTKFIKKEI